MMQTRTAWVGAMFSSVLLISMSALGFAGWANTYYIDFVTGENSNSGTSRKPLWKTLEKVNKFPFQPGDHILLKSGSVWQEQLAARSSRTLVSNGQGWSDGATFRNNMFYVQGIARYGHELKREEDGTFSTGPGWGGAKGFSFEGSEEGQYDPASH